MKNTAKYQFTLRTYKPGTPAEINQVFILNKGKNSGKPLTAPCPNCFVLTANSPAEADSFYWVIYTLWQGKAFHPYLIGSVIEFVRINDVKDLILYHLNCNVLAHNSIDTYINNLKTAHRKIAQLGKQVKLINELKKALSTKLYQELVANI